MITVHLEDLPIERDLEALVNESIVRLSRAMSDGTNRTYGLFVDHSSAIACLLAEQIEALRPRWSDAWIELKTCTSKYSPMVVGSKLQLEMSADFGSVPMPLDLQARPQILHTTDEGSEWMLSRLARVHALFIKDLAKTLGLPEVKVDFRAA